MPTLFTHNEGVFTNNNANVFFISYVNCMRLQYDETQIWEAERK